MTRVSASEFASGNHQVVENDNAFEQRAEYLTADELEGWTSLTPREEGVLRKLMGSGAKLLVGPRGCGKSTLMRIAYFRLISSRESLPIYVNYAKSLALEPFFHQRSDAIKIFRQWVIAKILNGLGKYFEESSQPFPQEVAPRIFDANTYIKQLEAGIESSSEINFAAPSVIVETFEKLCVTLSMSRVVLLLDDAAHAFSAEQQREFFEVFRELRSQQVAPKAAVYPGITSYSPNFHVGHEAEVLQAWLGVDDPAYLTSMKSLLERRFPVSLRRRLADKSDLIDYLAIASFGLPRGFINMLSELLGLEEDEAGSNRPRILAPRVVEGYSQSVEKIFSSLAIKIPKLKNYVETGALVVRKIVVWLRQHNAKMAADGIARRATVLGIAEPIPHTLQRILHMMEYAGLVRESASVSRGTLSFMRYQVHFGLLISQNALALGRNASIKSATDSLLFGDAQTLVRLRSGSLLTSEEETSCTLNLLPCAKCSSPRVFPEQRYCANCGSELRDGSVYLELLSTPIASLPLPRAKIDGIAAHTSLQTVRDILMDDEAQQLRRVPRIGPIWSKRIRTVAEEFVSV